MRASLLTLAALGLLGGTVPASPFNPSLAPKRVGDNGGTYTGTPGSGFAGFSAADQNDINTLRGGDVPAGWRPEMGWWGRKSTNADNTLSSTGAGAVVTEGQVRVNAHWLMPCVTGDLFSADQTIMMTAWAAALDGIQGGVASVDFMVEGNVFNVPVYSSLPIPCYGGKTRFFPGFYATLKALGLLDGEGLNIYVRINAAWSKVGSRVIGPMRLWYKPNGYDATVDFDTTLASNTAGVSYKDVPSIMDWSLQAANLGKHVLVRMRSDLDLATSAFNVSRVSTSNAAGHTGQLTFDGSYKAGGNAKLFCSTWAQVRFYYSGIVVRNALVDIANIYQLEAQSTPAINRLTRFDLCDFTSGNGPLEAPGSVGAGGKARRSVSVFNQNPIALTRCRVYDCFPNDVYAPAQIGCEFSNLGCDIQDVGGRQPYTIVCNLNDRISATAWRTPRRAMNLAYAGSGTPTLSILGLPGASVVTTMTLAYTGGGTATYDVTGAHGDYVPARGARTLTLRLNGVAVAGGTFTTGSGLVNMADLYAAINALGGGWSATLGSITQATLAATTPVTGGVPNYPFNKLCAGGRVADELTGIAVTSAGVALTWSNPRTAVLEVDTGSGPVAVKAFPSTANYSLDASTGNYYYIGDYGAKTGLVSAINAFGQGWSATVSSDGGDDFFFAAACGTAPAWASPYIPTSTGYAYSPFSHMPIRQADMGLATAFDLHVDIGQYHSASNHENHLHGGNISTQCAAQMMFPSLQFLAYAAFNCAYIGNLAQNDMGVSETVDLSSQISGPMFQMLMVDNSTPNSPLLIRLDYQAQGTTTLITALDETSRIDSNYVQRIALALSSGHYGTNAAMQGQIRRNVVGAQYTSQAEQQAFLEANGNVALSTKSGTASLADVDFADFPALATSLFTVADFKPVGPLRTRLAAKQVSHDAFGKARADLDMPGGVGLAA